MMRHVAFALALLASPALAEGEFSAGSNAKEWGLYGEETALFEARVVDIMCELTGDCPDNCGDGNRQMGLVRSADDALVLVSKNSQSSFNGAVEDLLPYCGQTVEVDGLLVGDPEFTPAKIFMVQSIKPEGGEWTKANRWTKAWAEQNPDAAGKGPWFRREPRIKALIEENGYLGLGKEIDEAFIAEWFQ